MKNLFPYRFLPLLTAYCLLFLLSCSPQKRLNRLVRKHPELVKIDTIWKKDTTVVFGTKTDTIIKIWQKDTVIIKRDQLTLKYFVRSDSTIYLEGECDTVWVIKEIPLTVNSLTADVRSPKERFVDYVLSNLLVILLIAVIGYYILRQQLKKPKIDG